MPVLVRSLGEEVADYLPNELAPLLTLFGEQVTKQFLSVCLGWGDLVLLSMAPVGIITVIISTIRVAEVKWLQALVGRARESKSLVEQELLSSTSRSVCELWSGNSIIRLIGVTGLKDIFIDDNGRVFDLWGAYHQSRADDQRPLHCSTYEHNSRDTAYLRELVGMPANLTLNLKRFAAGRRETKVLLCFSILLQAGALVYPALTAYYWPWRQTTFPHAYPCFVAGSLLIVAGLLACGRIIEGVTTEHEFRPNPACDSKYRVREAVRIQFSGSVGEQHFDSYAISTPVTDDLVVRTSRLNNNKYETSTLFAVFTTSLGFVLQFIGLRFLHFSATFVQLGATLLMAGVRALARRGLTSQLQCEPLPVGGEWEYLFYRALRIHGDALRLQREIPPGTPGSMTLFPDKATAPFDAMAQLPLSLQPVSSAHQLLYIEPVSAHLLGTTYCLKGAPSAGSLECLAHAIDVSIPIRLTIGHRPVKVAESDFAMQHIRKFRDIGITLGCAAFQPYDQSGGLVQAVIGRTAEFLLKSDEIKWKDGRRPLDSDAHRGTFITWAFDIVTGVLGASGARFQADLRLCVEDTNGNIQYSLDDQSEVVDTLLRLFASAVMNKLNSFVTGANSIPYSNGLKCMATYIFGCSDYDQSLQEAWRGHIVYRDNRSQQCTKLGPLGTDTLKHSGVPVFGLFLSSLAEINGELKPSTLSSSTSIEGDAQITHDQEYISRSSERRSDSTMRSLPPHQEVYLAYARYDSVVRHLERELYGIFLLAMVFKVEQIGGTTKFLGNRRVEVSGACLEGHTGRAWSNTVFDGIAQILLDTNFAENLPDALSIVLPPFLRCNLLPLRAHDRITFRSSPFQQKDKSSPREQTGTERYGNGRVGNL